MPYETDYSDLWQNYDPDGPPIDRLMSKLIGQQQMIQATIQEVKENIEGDIEYNRSQITQTAEEIRQEVLQIKENIDGNISDANSLISQTAEEILHQVTLLEESVAGDVTDMQSLITQTAEGISAEVTRIDGEVESAKSLIQQNAESISLRVESVETTIETLDTGQTDLVTRVNTAEQKILPTAIVSTVRSSTQYASDLNGKVGTNEVISRINQTAESISIQASKINLSGAVTFNDLNNAAQNIINGKTDQSQVTSIVGGIITTDTLDLGRQLRLSGSGDRGIQFRSGAYLGSYDQGAASLRMSASDINLDGRVHIGSGNLYLGGSVFDGTARFG